MIVMFCIIYRVYILRFTFNIYDYNAVHVLNIQHVNANYRDLEELTKCHIKYEIKAVTPPTTEGCAPMSFDTPNVLN